MATDLQPWWRVWKRCELLWLILLATAWSSVDGTYNCINHCSCRMKAKALIADCSALNFTQVPQSSTYQVDVLIMNFNLLSYIKLTSFATFTKLTDVRLTGNRLHAIESGSFQSLARSNLTRLDMSRNRLSRLPITELRRLTHCLEYLKLSFNALKTFPPALSEMQRLKELDISQNSLIYSLPTDPLPASMVALNMAYTSVRKFARHNFANSFNMRHLVMSDNLASGAVQFETKTFEPLFALEHLDLSRCFCRRLPLASFTKMANLSTLLLQSSYIRSMPVLSVAQQNTTRGPGVTNVPGTTGEMGETTLDGKDGLARRKRFATRSNGSSEFDVGLSDDTVSDEDPTYRWCNPLLRTLDLSHNRKLRLSTSTNARRPLFPPSLTALEVGYTILPSVRGFYFANLENLTSLGLCSSRVTSIDGDAFASLQNLQAICLSGNPIAVAPQLPPSLREINITATKMTNLTRNFLENLTSLTAMDISNGLVNFIEPGAFSNMHNLRLLNLSRNSLQDLEETTLLIGDDRSNSSLEVVDLAFNQLASIEGAAFASHRKLQRLNIRDNRLVEINEQTLTGLNSLKTLELSRNLLADIAPNALRDLQNVEEIFLADNELEIIYADQFKHASKLRTLHLADNKLLDIHDQHFPSLIVLDLKRNNLTDFPTIFAPRLTSLDASSNDLEGVPVGVLQGLPSLENLALHDNTYFNVHNYSTFIDVAQLKRLDMARCQVRRMIDVVIPVLTTVDLSSNAISSIDSPVDEILPAIQELDLSFNNLSTIYPEAFNASTTLKALNLQGNNFRCDCRLLSLVHWIQDNMQRETLDLIGAYSYLCEAPSSAFAQPILLFVPRLDCTPTPSGPTSSIGIYAVEIALGVVTALAIIVAVTVACYCRRRLPDASSSSLSSVAVEAASERRSLSVCCSWIVLRLRGPGHPMRRTRDRGRSDDEGRDLMINTPLTSPVDEQAPDLL